MAKKKKKAVANPARGFATTSVASKPKFDKNPDSTEVSDGEQLSEKPEVLKGSDAAISSKNLEENQPELHQLSPEDLEERLDQNELQLLVEKHSTRVKRDSSRQISKVLSDCRVLRQQSRALNTKQWLPVDLLDDILKMARKEILEERQQPEPAKSAREISEEEVVVRLWTLAQTLCGLGISKELVFESFNDLLSKTSKSTTPASIWGFQESMDILALNLSEKDLPSYDERKEIGDGGMGSGDRLGLDPSVGTEQLSIIPRSLVSSPTPKTSGTNSPQRGFDTVKTTNVDLLSTQDFDVSDLDSDMDPDELVASYVSTKARLFSIEPQLAEDPNSNPSWRKLKSGKTKAESQSRPMSPGLRKLQEKLNRLESDILFDKQKADHLWTGRRRELAQDRKQTPNSTLWLEGTSLVPEPRHHSTNATDDEPSSESEKSQSIVDDDPSSPDFADGDLLGAMFSSPEDQITDKSMIPGSGNNTAASLRDFGKMAGIKPRRILEDACRGRDPQSTVKYQLVSATTYLSRHSVTVSWSKEQERVPDESLPSITFVQHPSSGGRNRILSSTITMTGIATPDVHQSEAFVSTAALFCLFVSSARDEKLSLKLPSTWRDVWSEFADHRRSLLQASDRKTLKEIRKIVQEHRENEENDGLVFSAALSGRVTRDQSGSRHGSRDVSLGPFKRSAQHQSGTKILWDERIHRPAYQRMLLSRMGLPIFGFREVALATIEKSQVTILCGETGCGKSTQLPAYILESEMSQGRDCKIYCTEPRRISAISLALRVGEELGERENELGTASSFVGYAVRLESRIASQSRLVYVTTGVVLRMLESSKSLTEITHLIIDEVHERSIETDFLLIILQSLMIRRPELKVVLMSATVNASRFSKYLNDAPVINVPGRTFPVEAKFLEDAIELTQYTGTSNNVTHQDDGEEENEDPEEASGISKDLQGYSIATRNTLSEYDEYRIDYSLILKLMERIISDPEYSQFSKAILIFMPGISEIREMNDMLVGHEAFGTNCRVYPMHSSISSEEQREAFVIAPPGVRKVVIATNIAETGITIPDITLVIDTGKHKEMRYDERRQFSRLIQSFISRANAKQRRGRAGRVQEGLCFHLFTRKRHDELLPPQQTPEMLRLSLQDLVMRVKICGLGDAEQTLSKAPDPPSSKNIRRAVDSLHEVGALNANEELTQLGRQLARLPLEANLGKLCLLSAIFGCLDAGLTIAAILSSKSPFVTPFGARQQADASRLAFAKGDSDLLTAYNAYCAWRRVSRNPGQSVFAFCRRNFLSPQTLDNIEDLKSQLMSSICDTGMVKLRSYEKEHLRPRTRGSGARGFVNVPPEYDTNSTNEMIITAVIAWSFYPKLLVRDGKGWRNVNNSQSVSLHPTSINRGNLKPRYLSYYSMMQTNSKMYNALATSSVSEFPLAMLVGEADFKLHAGILTIDGNRLRFALHDWKTTIAIKVLRARIEECVRWAVGNAGMEMNPRLEWWKRAFEKICTKDITGRDEHM